VTIADWRTASLAMGEAPLEDNFIAKVAHPIAIPVEPLAPAGDLGDKE
jgi:hypothetical protein